MLNREYPSPEQLHHLYLLLFLGLIVITFTHSQKQSPSTLHSLLSVTNQYHILHLFFSFFSFSPPFLLFIVWVLLLWLVTGHYRRQQQHQTFTEQKRNVTAGGDSLSSLSWRWFSLLRCNEFPVRWAVLLHWCISDGLRWAQWVSSFLYSWLRRDYRFQVGDLFLGLVVSQFF